MATEIRRVPKDWRHPKGKNLMENYASEFIKWDLGKRLWKLGLVEVLLDEPCPERLPGRKSKRAIVPISELRQIHLKACYENHQPGSGYPCYASCDPDYEFTSWEEYGGEKPDREDYMPVWDEEDMTHYQAYSNTCEGYPVSPVCETEQQCWEWAKAGTYRYE